MTPTAPTLSPCNQPAGMRALLLASATRCCVRKEQDWWSSSILLSGASFALANQFALDDGGLEDPCQYAVDQAANFLLLVREQI